IVMFGFPFEAITSAANRATIMDRVFDFFNIAPPNPDLNDDLKVNAGDYVLWRKSQNTAVVAGTAGHAARNGKGNHAHYHYWSGQYGNAVIPGSGASLDESSDSSAAGTALSAASASDGIVAKTETVGGTTIASLNVGDAAFSPLVVDGAQHGALSQRRVERVR